MKDALALTSLTGRIGKPMITLHGDLDALLPIETDSDVYTDLVAASGNSRSHCYYVVEDGNHVDGLVDAGPRSCVRSSRAAARPSCA